MERKTIDCIEYKGEFYDINKIKELLNEIKRLSTKKDEYEEKIIKLERMIDSYKIIFDSKKKRGTF